MLNSLRAQHAIQFGTRPREANVPLFLTGFARSGTTWVNQLLREYFDAGFVNEGQFIISFGLRLGYYGDLRRDVNFKRLLRDLRKDEFFSILMRNYSVDIDWQRVAAGPRDFSSVVVDILSQIAAGTGKKRIGSKYPVFGRHLDLINQLFPDCRVVHVIRDGRDCALSHKHMTWGHQNSYSAAVGWRDYLIKARAGAQALPGRYMEIRYEDLLAKPETSMTLLEQFISGVSPGPATQRYMCNANQLKPEKIARWRQNMPPPEQAIFEAVAGSTLQQFGYPLIGNKHMPSKPMRILYIAHDRLYREAYSWGRKVFPNISEYK